MVAAYLKRQEAVDVYIPDFGHGFATDGLLACFNAYMAFQSQFITTLEGAQ
jgi:hypothetical protein